MKGIVMDVVGLISTIVNTVLLIGILWYQINRNKVLSDRINEQSRLISETKDVVSQQATAVESQSRVVQAAIQYADAFNADKIKEIVKKELEIGHREEIRKIKEGYDKFVEWMLQHQDKSVKNIIAELSQKTFDDVVVPAVDTIVTALFRLPDNIREEIINQSQEGIVKDIVRNIIDKTESEMKKQFPLAQALQNLAQRDT